LNCSGYSTAQPRIIAVQEQTETEEKMWRALCWVINIYRMLRANPVVMLLVQISGELMAILPSGCVAKAFSLIREAASNPALNNEQKHQWVLERLKAEYPNAATNLINALIPLAIDAIKRGLV